MSVALGSRCWVVRTDRSVLDRLIIPELRRGILRQGWGYAQTQDLRRIRDRIRDGHELDWDERAAWARNRRLMPDEHDAISPGDLIVLPNVPQIGTWTIARAGESYDFEIAATHDHGHRRDVEVLREGLDPGVTDTAAALRRTMRCQRAMWNVDHLYADVSELIDGGLERPSPDRAFFDALAAAELAAWEVIERQFGGAEFEHPVRLLLRPLYDFVEHRAGPDEQGADFICRSMDAFGLQSIVAVQVKMWQGVAESHEPLDQIARAARRWRLTGGVIITSASTTSDEFDRAAVTLSADLGIPIRVVCRQELMRLLLSQARMEYTPPAAVVGEM